MFYQEGIDGKERKVEVEGEAGREGEGEGEVGNELWVSSGMERES